MAGWTRMTGFAKHAEMDIKTDLPACTKGFQPLVQAKQHIIINNNLCR